MSHQKELLNSIEIQVENKTFLKKVNLKPNLLNMRLNQFMKLKFNMKQSQQFNMKSKLLNRKSNLNMRSDLYNMNQNPNMKLKMFNMK